QTCALPISVKTIDYGYVGDIKAVNSDILAGFLAQSLVPVIAPLSYSMEGSLLNTNADTMASVIAVALAGKYKVSLVYCFEKDGVLSNPEDDSRSEERRVGKECRCRGAQEP